MAQMKIANWNIEWMNRWYTADNAGAPKLKPSEEISGVTHIDELATRVANVIKSLDADILTVQEGPSRREEMALFVRDFLGDAYDIVGPAGKGQQKLYALVRKSTDSVSGVFRMEEDLDFDFDDVWEVDIDADMEIDEYRFTRPPLVARVKTTSGKAFRLINLHTKSKYVHQGKKLWRDPASRPEFIKKALLARRRISAEAMRVRAYLNACFEEDPDAPIVVTGDFNDGPGLDFFEGRYLTHNVAGLIAGSPFEPTRMLRHGFIDTMDKAQNFTAIFDDFVDEIQDRKILLDHIFLSPSLYWTGAAVSAKGQIEHAVFEAQIDQGAPEGSRQRLPSDHRPQSVTVEV